MKKYMTRFLTAGMVALTVTGTAVAFTPATQVFAAETTSDDQESTRELKTMTPKEADAYVKELVGDTAPYQEYDYTKMYRVGNHVYSISRYEQEPEIINKDFGTRHMARVYYDECCERGMFDGQCKEMTKKDFRGCNVFDHATVTGKMPQVNLSIATYTIKPVENVTITANRTLITPDRDACLQMHIDEGADESTVHWRAICDEGVADLDVLGTEAYVTGHKNGTLIVVAETDDGIKDRIFLDVWGFDE